jgi:phosphoribosylformylglycinamidine synthase
VALAYHMPFISGKDSLHNEFHSADRHIAIPATLLISALGRIPDIRRCVTMDLKGPGDLLFLVGQTRAEMGGSHYHLLHRRDGGRPPQVDLVEAPRIFRGLFQAIQQGLVRACHDLSEGGFAVAAAEMAFAGEVGADLSRQEVPTAELTDEAYLFSESTTRFLVAITPANEAAFRACFPAGTHVHRVGLTHNEPRLRIAGSAGKWIIDAALGDLKEAWQRPLRW